MPATPPDPTDDPFDEADDAAAAPGRGADVTSRILAKHSAMKAGRGGTSRIERIRAEAAAAGTALPPTQFGPRPDVVLGIIVANGWAPADRLDELREFFFAKGVTQVLRKNGRVSSLLVDRGLLPPHLGRELELTLMDQGIFQRYRITRLLGQGLVGRTYVALDLSTGIDVAFKVFRQPDADKRQAFLDDFALLQRVNSRRIARALACGAHEDVCFAASTLIVGERLSTLIAERRIESEIHAARIALQIAEGLAYVHVSVGMCHRSLRPENVLVQSRERRLLSAVLTDFGVAEQIPPSRAIDPAWRAPETAADPGDERSDIYAVGAILYNLLGAIAGTPEPRGALDLAPFHPLTREIIYTASAPDPSKRYPDYRRFVAALARLPAELGFSEPDEVPAPDPGATEGEGTMFLRRARQPGQPLTGRRQRDEQDGWQG